jgi:surface protein
MGSSFFLVASSFAVFGSATAFNSDLSKWDMGAVTTMTLSKCTLSPSLWPRLPLFCFFITTTQVSSGHFSHVVVFFYSSVQGQQVLANLMRQQMAKVRQSFNIHRPFRMLSFGLLHVLTKPSSLFHQCFLYDLSNWLVS